MKYLLMTVALGATMFAGTTGNVLPAQLVEVPFTVVYDMPIPNCGLDVPCPPDCSDNCPWWNLWCMATCTNTLQ